jgi:hypothetical protein
MPFDLLSVVGTLAIKRPIFHSEADFQHALAWQIHERLPSYNLRLEYPRPLSPDRNIHVDIWLEGNHEAAAIEVKYKTRSLRASLQGENFQLLDQRAQPIGRYDFVKDIERLEKIASTNKNMVGSALMLTNDSAYWKIPKRADAVDAAFRIHDGRVLSGVLQWGELASEGTTVDRSNAITLTGTYELKWRDYSIVGDYSYSAFRFLCVQVGWSEL